MFNVTFYNFTKRSNSTKQPTGGTTYKCVVLNGTSVLNPKIELDIGLTSNPSLFNYCYIPDFHRYYYIREWSFDAGLWIASLNVDVLATYRSSIGSASLYVLRAANAYDGSIMDGKYPVKAVPTFDRISISTPYTSINQGCFVIGVVSKGGNFGSLTYHAMSTAEMAGLCTALQDPTLISGDANFSLNDASAGLQLNLIDPMQYIKSCVWLPISTSSISGTDIPASGPTGGFDIYNWHLTGFTHRIISNTAPYVTITRTISTLKNHPQKTSRGAYMNYSPYTIATLSFPPFGVFELDTSMLGNANSLGITLQLDPLTGSGSLITQANNNIMNRLEAQVGVPIALSQVTRDYIGAVSNALGAVGNIAGAITGAATGNIAGAIGGIASGLSGIINGACSLVPRANTIGSGGGFAHLQGTFELDYQFFTAVDDDITQNGRPLCQMRTPSTLGGYMLIQDGDVPTAGTAIENEKIKGYLETGFYYE